MRFLVDECTGPAVAEWLRKQGHDVFSVFEESRGTDDDTIIRKAFEADSILITNDKDFGEKVYRDTCNFRDYAALGEEYAAGGKQQIRKEIRMQSITINISNDKLADKITWLLEHFKNKGLEIVSKEDMEDLKLLKATRNEDSVPFDEYIKNED